MPLSRLTSETHATSCHHDFYFGAIQEKNREHSSRTAGAKSEEGVGYDRSVWPGYPRLHAAYNDWDNVMQLRKEKLILETLS